MAYHQVHSDRSRPQSHHGHRRRIGSLILVGLSVLLAVAVPGRADEAYTSTRHVTGMVRDGDSGIWVATTGGILRREAGGRWTRFTRAQGLPTNEARGLELDAAGHVCATFAHTVAVWSGHGWDTHPVAARADGVLAEIERQGVHLRATALGAQRLDGRVWRDVPYPLGPGTHISALADGPDGIWAAFHGDGLYCWDGTAWRSAAPALPLRLRECTALALVDDRIFLGTRADGVWECEAGIWRRTALFDEPPAGDVQSLAAYDGRVFVGTLEDGLGVWQNGTWSTLGPPLLSSAAPRQMAVFDGRLFVRHGGGAVDVFDGTNWHRGVERAVPRKQATTLAADADRLYLGQVGGWSEFNGRGWRHVLHLPELSGTTVTCILPDGGTLWLGTQGRGLARIDRVTLRVNWLNEASGLEDDWITSLCKSEGNIYVGTFSGGTSVIDASGKVRGVSAPARVCALAVDAGRVLLGTREGLYRCDGEHPVDALGPRAAGVDREVQALLSTPDGLWIGTRTGLYFVTR